MLVAPPNSKGTTLLLDRASTKAQEAFIGNQAGGRVFLFLATDDFWRDYNRMVQLGNEFITDRKSVGQGKRVDPGGRPLPTSTM